MFDDCIHRKANTGITSFAFIRTGNMSKKRITKLFQNGAYMLMAVIPQVFPRVLAIFFRAADGGI